MIHGTFRSGHPRIQLTLPGQNGPLNVHFIVDTGFDGEFALPSDIGQKVEAHFAGPRYRRLADGSLAQCPCMEMLWQYESDEERIVEILVLDGTPLVGTQLLTDHMLQVEIIEGGNVLVECL